MNFIGNCKNLIKLDLVGVNVNNIDILSTCPALQILHLIDVEDLVDISVITKLTYINEIVIYSNKLDICNISIFPCNLTILFLTGDRMNGNMRFTSKLQQLKLDFQHYANGLSFLNTNLIADNLIMLDLGGYILLEIQYIANCINLEDITLTGVTDNNARLFINLTKLKAVCIKDSSLTNLNKLRNCTQLIYLTLTNNLYLTDITAIGNFSLLENFYYENCPIITNFNILARCTNLVTVSLTSPNNVALSIFKRCQNLVHLYLNNTIISKEEILAACKQEDDDMPILISSEGYIMQ